LDALIAQAEDFAQFSMRTRGKVPPTLFAISPARPLFFIPSSMPDDLAKDSFANTARLICIAHAATAAVLILEAWMTMAAPGRPLDMSVPPSESLHRREVVILTAENRKATKQKILPIIRTGAGGFHGFGEFGVPAETTYEGRFAQILPPKPSTPAMQAKARALLAALGISPDAIRRDWSEN
jgi:hypothetical protein